MHEYFSRSGGSAFMPSVLMATQNRTAGNTEGRLEGNTLSKVVAGNHAIMKL